MTARLVQSPPALRLADLGDLHERDRIDDFLDSRGDATPFHSLAWLEAVEAATGHAAHVLVCEQRGRIVGFLPLHRVTSLFGNALVSSGFVGSPGTELEFAL